MAGPVSLRSARKPASRESETRYPDGVTNKHRRFRVVTPKPSRPLPTFSPGRPFRVPRYPLAEPRLDPGQRMDRTGRRADGKGREQIASHRLEGFDVVR